MPSACVRTLAHRASASPEMKTAAAAAVLLSLIVYAQ